ncbi:hypothetical protein D1AOALGA4SA_8381 [Olavius algarvensis Delta 1 endosymbiont]|nr:hypothetical protein D1AOALGA4SA_8381 [Olavius algarvensis Delta 1 endosymbiont]
MICPLYQFGVNLKNFAGNAYKLHIPLSIKSTISNPRVCP